MSTSASTRARFPRMIRGSVVVQRRRCGTATCRCADGERLHASTVLSYSDQGRNNTVMLTAEEIEKARAAASRYRAAQAKLQDEGNAGLAELLARRAATRRGR